MLKAAKIFNGGYAVDPYKNAERDSAHSNPKDISRDTRNIAEYQGDLPEHSALNSTLKGALIGGAVGAGLGAAGGGLKGAIAGTAIGGLTAGLAAGVTRATSNSNIRESKAIKKLKDKDLARIIINKGYEQKINRERANVNKINRNSDRNTERILNHRDGSKSHYYSRRYVD